MSADKNNKPEEYRTCKQCSINKNINEFYTRTNNGKLYHFWTCKSCISINNKQHMSIEENKEKKRKREKNRYIENREEILSKQKKYEQENPEKKREAQRIYNEKTGYQVNYRKNNKEKLKEKAKIRTQNRYNNDLNFRLKQIIRRSIWGAIKNSGGSKNRQSFLDHIGYSIDDFRFHIEKQFGYWMNWNNYGKYDAKTWDDNDPATWTWNIDHIIPQSAFKYQSMEDEDFKKCWALSNLRPLSSKQNYLDGIFKVRHNDRK